MFSKKDLALIAGALVHESINNQALINEKEYADNEELSRLREKVKETDKLIVKITQVLYQ